VCTHESAGESRQRLRDPIFKSIVFRRPKLYSGGVTSRFHHDQMNHTGCLAFKEGAAYAQSSLGDTSTHLVMSMGLLAQTTESVLVTKGRFVVRWWMMGRRRCALGPDPSCPSDHTPSTSWIQVLTSLPEVRSVVEPGVYICRLFHRIRQCGSGSLNGMTMCNPRLERPRINVTDGSVVTATRSRLLWRARRGDGNDQGT